MSNKKSMRKNFLYNILYEVVAIIVPFATAPYVARVLGASNVGINNLVSANVTYFTLIAALGSVSYAKREIAFHQENVKKRSDSFWGILVFRLICTLAALTAYVCFVAATKQYSVYYWISTVTIISVLFDIGWFFQGVENFKATVARNTAIRVLATLAVFTFVKKEADLGLYVFINVMAQLLGNLSLWFILPKYICRIDWKSLRLKKHLTGSLKLFVPVVAIQIYTVVDKTMLGALTTVLQVSYYAQAEKIVKLGITIINALALVLLPRMSALLRSQQYDTAVTYYGKSVDLAFFLAMPMMCGFALISDDFIPFFLGPGYDGAISVMKILSMLMVVLGLAQIIGTPLLIPLKRENQYTICVCIGAISNLIANYLLIPSFGAVGAAVATILSETLVTGMEMFYIKDVFPLNKIMGSFMHYLLPSFVMTAFVLGVKMLCPPGNIRMILLIGFGIATYLLSLIMMRDKFLKENIKLMLKK